MLGYVFSDKKKAVSVDEVSEMRLSARTGNALGI
jgi:hypothetical protein